MRKVILSMMVSLDGYIEGADRDLNWHVWDDEMSNYMTAFFNTVDPLLYGRVAYELMLQYWPKATENPSSTIEEIEFARKMNDFKKIVFSKTLAAVEWECKPHEGKHCG